MDTSSPAAFVNAELLKRYVGRRVRALVKVMGIEDGVMIGESTDGHVLKIRNHSPASHMSTFVEVIGIADGNESIHAEICTKFGEKCGVPLEL